jgi:hypothetical protein
MIENLKHGTNGINNDNIGINVNSDIGGISICTNICNDICAIITTPLIYH